VRRRPAQLCCRTANVNERAVRRFRIGLSADGIAVMRSGEPVADLCENMSLITANASYARVNTRQIWAPGTVNLVTGKIHIDAYMQ